MTTLLNYTNPYLRIYNPDSGEYAQFIAGRLEIDQDDPNFALVMANAASNPATTIVEFAKDGHNCPECGALYRGQAGMAQLGKHRKDAHFDSWMADKNAAHQSEVNLILKERAGIACDACTPAQVFGDDEALIQHIRLVHIGDDAALNAVTARRPGEVQPG